MMLISSIILTLGNNYIIILIGEIVYEIAIVFLNIANAVLKNNLELESKGNEYIKIKTRFKYNICNNNDDNIFYSRLYV